MKISRKGIDLITKWEGCKLVAYKDGGGVWTIGYGHTSAAGDPKVVPGMKITLQEAKDIFVRDIVKYEMAVRNALKKAPTQAQFDAMVSLCYNIGPAAFAGSSVLRKFNNGDLKGAQASFGKWIKDNGKVIKGLVNRRADEARHFNLDIPFSEQERPEPAQNRTDAEKPVLVSYDVKPPPEVKSEAPVRLGWLDRIRRIWA